MAGIKHLMALLFFTDYRHKKAHLFYISIASDGGSIHIVYLRKYTVKNMHYKYSKSP